MVHLGTNGICTKPTQLAAETMALLEVLYKAIPTTVILLATLIHEVDAPNIKCTQPFNTLLPAVVAAQAAKGRQIRLVDMWNKTNICIPGDPGCCAP